jgi:hypothetical protein
VVETSPHSLSVRYGGSWQAVYPRRSCVLIFSKDAISSPRLAMESLHMLAQHLMAQLLPLQEPCVVKVASDEEYPSRV